MPIGYEHTLIKIPWEEFWLDYKPSLWDVQRVLPEIYEELGWVLSEWQSHDDEARAEDSRRTHPRLTEIDYGIKIDDKYFYIDIYDGGKSQFGYLWFGNLPMTGWTIRSSRGAGGYFAYYDEKKRRTVKAPHMLVFYSKLHGHMIQKAEVRPISEDVIQTFQGDIKNALRKVFDTYDYEEREEEEEINESAWGPVERETPVVEVDFDVDPYTGFIIYS